MPGSTYHDRFHASHRLIRHDTSLTSAVNFVRLVARNSIDPGFPGARERRSADNIF
jgi:hypothetical protein